jgi:hypothetical protein
LLSLTRLKIVSARPVEGRGSRGEGEKGRRGEGEKGAAAGNINDRGLALISDYQRSPIFLPYIFLSPIFLSAIFL